MERPEIISLLKSRFPDAEVFASTDENIVCVRSVIGQSNFGNGVTVPITDTKRYHLDTIRFRLMNPLFDWKQWEWRSFRVKVAEAPCCIIEGCEQPGYMGKMCHNHFFGGGK